MAITTAKHVASLIGSDATGTPITYTAGAGPMDFSLQGVEAGMVESIPVYSNGTFFELVEGAQKAIPFSFTLFQDGQLAASSKPLGMVLKQNTFSAGVSKDPGLLVWTVNVVMVITRSGVSSTITLTNCRLVADFGTEPDTNKIKISGIAYGTGSTLPVVFS